MNAMGLTPSILTRLRSVLRECRQFKNDDDLRALFIDARIQAWRDDLPTATTVGSRIDRVINYLYTKFDDENENALVLLLCVLVDYVDPNDARHRELMALADELDLAIKFPQPPVSSIKSDSSTPSETLTSETYRRQALLIASFLYEDSCLRQLLSPPQDAQALAEVLRDPAVGAFEVKLLLNKPSYEVRREIENFFRTEHHARDLLLLYFSGHGIKDTDGQLYFAMSDTRRGLLDSTAIPANFVHRAMMRSYSQRQILFLDCCYSGAFARDMVTKSDMTVNAQTYFNQGRGRVVFTASDEMQYAFEGRSVRGKSTQSVFTQAVIQGLQTGEADRDSSGYVSLDELYDYVYDYVLDHTPGQQPHKWELGVQGKIMIARNPYPVAKLSDELKQAMRSMLPGIRRGAVAELAELLDSENVGLIHTTIAALNQLAKDDNLTVANAARQRLRAYEIEKQQVVPIVDQGEPVASEIVSEVQSPAECVDNERSFSEDITGVELATVQDEDLNAKVSASREGIETYSEKNSLSHTKVIKSKLGISSRIQQRLQLLPLPTWAVVLILLAIISGIIVFVLLKQLILVPVNTIELSTESVAEISIPSDTPTLSVETTATIPSTKVFTFTDDPGSSPMVFIPGGTYMMGSGDMSESSHEVELVSFYIDQYEVTNERYGLCVEEGVCDQPHSLGDGRGNSYYDGMEYSNYPVIYVDWQQAYDHCAWRSGRLPTEAEWEYVARSCEEGVAYYATTGEKIINFDNIYDGPTEVGFYREAVNCYGTYDMLGNVWEWTNDWHEEKYHSHVKGTPNPTGPSSGTTKVLRGGSWKDSIEKISAIYRGFTRPETSESYIGFRCVRDAEP